MNLKKNLTTDQSPGEVIKGVFAARRELIAELWRLKKLDTQQGVEREIETFADEIMAALFELGSAADTKAKKETHIFRERHADTSSAIRGGLGT